MNESTLGRQLTFILTSPMALELSEKQMSKLNEASAIELGFPHESYEREMVKRFVHGGMGDRILAA